MTTSSDFVFARASRANQTIRLLGELLITLGVVVFLFIGYELWFNGLYTEHAQSQLNHQLQTLWAAPPSPSTSAGPASSASPSATVSGSPGPTSVPAASAPTLAPIALPGDAIGIIRIPRLGTRYGYAIVEGVSTDDLKKGPGHYPGTANPGGIGNFVVSGHRTTYLAPFNGLGELAVVWPSTDLATCNIPAQRNLARRRIPVLTSWLVKQRLLMAFVAIRWLVFD